eukprot:3501178-Prymnesium_polylepis.2
MRSSLRLWLLQPYWLRIGARSMHQRLRFVRGGWSIHCRRGVVCEAVPLPRLQAWLLGCIAKPLKTSWFHATSRSRRKDSTGTMTEHSLHCCE